MVYAGERLIVAVHLVAVLFVLGLGSAALAADFEADIRPLLARHCIGCHGPQKQEGGLRLDQRAAALRGGDSYAPGIVPGSSDSSPLFQFVSREDADRKMPPKGPQLSAGEIQALKEWIDAGADWPDAAANEGGQSTHWAFQPLVRPAVPAQAQPVEGRAGMPALQSIDAFIREKLAEQHLAPSPEADHRTLIRRLSFDLLGLPPSPKEVAAFIVDPDPLAYEKLVDRYLASPQFGERAARFWLDTVRFAESDGFETNQPRPHAWRYRDYVIDAFNRDLPYDQFVKEQLAGDQLEAGVATGFLVGGAWDRVKSPDPVLTAQQRADELHDMVSTTGSVFLGLTVGCARCHSHKFDPIPQTDYYAMKAVFEGVMHGDREIAAPVTPLTQQRVETLTREIADFDGQLREFEPLATLRDTHFIRPTDTARTGHLLTQPTPAIATGSQRGASLDPGQGAHCPNLSAGYLYWKIPAGTDAFTWKPQLTGQYRFWVSWGCGHKSHSTDARYLVDRDGDLTTKEDQREFLKANHQRFADESDSIPEEPLWSGLKDGGVVELTPSSVVLLRQGNEESFVTADVAVFQAVSGEAEDRPALRVPVTRDLNVDRFAPVSAKFLRFTVLATSDAEPCIDELEVMARMEGQVSRFDAGDAGDPEGVTEISRWLSAATPPVTESQHGPHPGGMAEPDASLSLFLRVVKAGITHSDDRDVSREALAAGSDGRTMEEPAASALPLTNVSFQTARRISSFGSMTRGVVALNSIPNIVSPPAPHPQPLSREERGAGKRTVVHSFVSHTPPTPEYQNIALSSLGTKATASGTYPNNEFHKLEHIHDGLYGNAKSWISNETGRGWIQFEFPKQREISEVRWSRDRANSPQFADRVATSYVIEASVDGQTWSKVASSGDRLPYSMTVPGGRLIRAEGADAQQRFTALQTRREALSKELAPLIEKPKAYAGQFVTPPPTMRLSRGDVTQPKEVVAPASLSELVTPVKLAADAPEAQRRMALADWITSRDNPLTARVIVNRLWLQHFGEGLVDTPSDFGANGGKPTHPELLDWLASELMGERRETRDERQEPETGSASDSAGSRLSSLPSRLSSPWSLKHIHRLICLSATYRQSSSPRDDGLAIDGASRLLWRYPSRRLEAESIRDAILTVSGQLDLRPGGPGFDLFEANTNYVKVYNSKREFTRDDFRRMIYQNKPRMQLEDTFGNFDCPDAGQVTPKRTSSTTALQALSLLNSPFLLQQSQAFATRLEQATSTTEDRVGRAFEVAFGRSPTEDERTKAVEFVNQHGLTMFCRALFNTHEFVMVR